MSITLDKSGKKIKVLIKNNTKKIIMKNPENSKYKDIMLKAAKISNIPNILLTITPRFEKII